MKTTSTFLLFLSLCSSAFAASGKEIVSQIAPLVNDRTAFVAYADLSRIDFHAVCENAVAEVEPFLTSLAMDDRSVKGVGKEAKKLILKGEKSVQEYIDVLTIKCGVTDFYLLGQSAEKKADSRNRDPDLMFAAIPIKNRTKEQQEALRKLSEETETQEIEGFQVIVLRDFLHTVPPDRLKVIRGEPGAEQTRRLENAFHLTKDADIRAVVLATEDMTDEVSFSTRKTKSETERQFNDLLFSMSSKIQWVALACDLKKMELNVIFEAGTEAEAANIEKDYMKAVELGCEAARAEMEKDKDTAFMAPLVVEFAKGFFKANQPKHEESRFVLKYENKPLFSAVLGGYIGAAYFMLPPLLEDE